MKNNTYIFTFFLGLTLLVLSGLGVFMSLKKSTVASDLYYQIGRISSVQGYTKKIITKNESLDAKEGEKLFSKESFDLGKDSFIEFQIAQDDIKIIGPAKFSFNLVDPNTKEVFINFSDFTSVEPKKNTYKNIKLTYRGWMIEPFFSKDDLEKNTGQKVELPPVLSGDEEADKTPLKGISDEERSNYLVEIISLKRPLLKKCYENYLKNNPMATGKLVVEFTLQNNGRVSSSKIKDSSFFKDDLFRKCIQNVFTRVKSRPFSGDPILITYPIEFE